MRWVMAVSEVVADVAMIRRLTRRWFFRRAMCAAVRPFVCLLPPCPPLPPDGYAMALFQIGCCAKVDWCASANVMNAPPL